MEKECFGWKKIERKESIRHSLIATKFHLKMTLLNFWILLTQKGYFRIKKMKITIKFYIFKLIYNHFHIILRLFDVLPDFTFIKRCAIIT